MKKILSSLLVGAMLISSVGTISIFADEPEVKVSATTVNTHSKASTAEIKSNKATRNFKRNRTKLKKVSFWQRNKATILKVTGGVVAAAATATAFYLVNKYVGANPTVKNLGQDVNESSDNIQGSINSVSSGESKPELVEGLESNTKSENLLEFTLDTDKIVEFPSRQMDNKNVNDLTKITEEKQVDIIPQKVDDTIVEDDVTSTEGGQFLIDDKYLNLDNQFTHTSQEKGENTNVAGQDETKDQNLDGKPEEPHTVQDKENVDVQIEENIAAQNEPIIVDFKSGQLVSPAIDYEPNVCLNNNTDTYIGQNHGISFVGHPVSINAEGTNVTNKSYSWGTPLILGGGAVIAVVGIGSLFFPGVILTAGLAAGSIFISQLNRLRNRNAAAAMSGVTASIVGSAASEAGADSVSAATNVGGALIYEVSADIIKRITTYSTAIHPNDQINVANRLLEVFKTFMPGVQETVAEHLLTLSGNLRRTGEAGPATLILSGEAVKAINLVLKAIS
ncbi:MAG: hypothetical protein RUMPE_00280 [Eubacteriales bacterium SKADARSKE-1]|nr:hypothetical protein [Eubacteriales bacterium SKADARSKE-1]